MDGGGVLRQYGNIAHFLTDEAERQPRQRALIFRCGQDAGGHPAYTHLTFGQLDALSDRYAWGMRELGVRPGLKALLMIRPSLDFYGLVFALFKVGAVPVMIDPGMGWKGFFRCVEQVGPEVFLGIPAAQALRRLHRRTFATVRINLTLGGRLGALLGGVPVSALRGQPGPYPIHEPSPDELAAVLFTSGSTGPAKGVSYTHRIFATQIEILRREYGIQPGEVDLACFPLFSLFSVALGATAAIPDMDPTRPAFVEPRHIVEPINSLGVTYSFGSPTLWERVARACVEQGITLPGLRRVIMAGSPVPGRVHELLLNHVLEPGAETFTPYGATESLPVANFRGSDMLAETWAATRQGKGMCVGVPLADNDVRIIAVSDDVIPAWHDGLVLADGLVGEICVKGPVVTREYYRRPEATAAAKIADGDAVWHRLGDLGYLDARGRLWFCGRKAHRVETAAGVLYSVCCEAIFNDLPGVRRSALVGLGRRPRQDPAIVIEPEPGKFAEVSAQADMFRAAASAHPLTAAITNILFHRQFPVDVRHNAKINREALAAWAAAQG